MKKLVRGDSPLCLARFKHGRDNWSVISSNGLTNDIWASLNVMQHGFCAYCECQLQEDNTKRHIEHFIQKDREPSKTFNWNNLFGSCNNPNRCGKFKDEAPAAKNIDLSKVCKPDVMDASELILFLNSGKVRARTILAPQQKELADNTITVFNLDGDSTLENSRKAAIAGEKSLADSYWEMLADDDSGELAVLLEAELSEALIRIKQVEHSTALVHLWMHNEQF
ncbi:TPA: TIGR02646 family protein [Vibrio parahaemolyticus]|uniref:retron Ec78 anti-phage system effector HNH endonuclease PtuB n=1 Tax=Vibrio parahaemolyticus TaxID=670 RepID=UPI000946974D|nr:retron Ec78 anti-phage system effector HNH endonuclease PtuB [Vibrio parahaemolyticus]EJB8408505.1 TIGR02646 family protein [Vibrio parahaemolyticus]EJB8533281.1 TIGR02646 family protein [Vibrio parahaemolyticus]EJG1617647.1 TIGR02646 family protein [Vibrio parahaemolyticus]EJX5603633.1 TIGR02646 family protein [Vibrio parahaemolyticus]EJX5604902.1 TIGR02646 family protein [Vibrio parahaemolyticus]